MSLCLVLLVSLDLRVGYYPCAATSVSTPSLKKANSNKAGLLCPLCSLSAVAVANVSCTCQTICPAICTLQKSVNAPGNGADELHERKFWKALGVNPPLYGADTPQSLFDEELEFGWNLRKLGCLLHEYDIPDIPGVTTPMTYFGMWRVRDRLISILTYATQFDCCHKCVIFSGLKYANVSKPGCTPQLRGCVVL